MRAVQGFFLKFYFGLLSIEIKKPTIYKLINLKLEKNIEKKKIFLEMKKGVNTIKKKKIQNWEHMFFYCLVVICIYN